MHVNQDPVYYFLSIIASTFFLFSILETVEIIINSTDGSILKNLE